MKVTSYLVIIFCLIPETLAQNGNQVFSQWRQGQINAMRAVGSITLTENVRCVVDGKNGRDELRWEVRFQKPSSRPELIRRALSATFNGMAFDFESDIPPRKQIPEAGAMSMRLCREYRILMPHFLLDLLPEANALSDVFNGLSAWKIRLNPTHDRRDIQVAEAWFSKADGRILGAQVVLSPLKPLQIMPPMNVRVTYERNRNGLDLIKRAESLMTYQRKVRQQLFHTVMTFEANYTSYTFVN